jgi:hypothetical protein
MCPKYNWIGPSYGLNNGEVNPSTTETNLEVTLRQFAFTTTDVGFYYQCEVLRIINQKYQTDLII